jgi:S-formylglutathione hydrolase FrmB
VSTSPDSLDDLTDSSEMVDHLKRCGFSNEIGLDVSVLYDTHGMNIPDAALTNLEGIGTSKKQLNLVKEAIKGFRAPAGAKR